AAARWQHDGSGHHEADRRGQCIPRAWFLVWERGGERVAPGQRFSACSNHHQTTHPCAAPGWAVWSWLHHWLFEGKGLEVTAAIEACLHNNLGRARTGVDDGSARRATHLPGVVPIAVSQACPLIELRTAWRAGVVDDDVDAHVGLTGMDDDQ